MCKNILNENNFVESVQDIDYIFILLLFLVVPNASDSYARKLSLVATLLGLLVIHWPY